MFLSMPGLPPSSSVCFSAIIPKILKARTARAEMVQPFVGLRKRDFVLCDAPEHCRVGTSDSARIREVFRQSAVEQIQYPLFFLVEFLLFSQNASLSNEVAS